MKKTILFAIIFSFLFAAAAFAQEIDLPSPVLTPDSNFYFLKSWKESIQTFFTFGAENKAKQFLHLAEARLAEYRKMVEKGKMEIAEKTIQKYEKQLNRALEKTEEAKEKGKNVTALKEEISEKILRHQEVLLEVLEKVPVEARKGIKNAIENSQKGVENAVSGLTGVEKEEIEQRIEKIGSQIKKRFEVLKEKLPEPAPGAVEKVEQEDQQEKSALSETSTTTRTATDYDQGGAVSPPKPAITGQSEFMNIKYYICPDGTKVESGKCDTTGSTCSMLLSPERQCPQITTPVIRWTECSTAGEIKYFKCADGTQIPWCACGPESGLPGAKNKWQCQYYPVGFTCPKPAISTITPTPSVVACCFHDGMCKLETEKECSAKGAKVYGSSCSPNPCPVPTPAVPNPATDYIYGDCTKEGMKTYKCPSGNIINWKCSCLVSEPEDPKYRSGGYTTWSCTVEPEKYCPLASEAPLAITHLYLKYYKPTSIEVCWVTNKAIISRYVEYGTTASYGFTKESGSSDEAKIRGCAYLPSQTYDEPGALKPDEPGALNLKPDTNYHFRIVAEDATGNKIISDDYTFTTGL